MSNVGDSITANRASWCFGGDVPKTFEDHVSKSVPLYNEGHELICDISDFFVSNESVVYEMGCSTGLLTKKIAKHCNNKKDARFIGVDIELDMIEFAKIKILETDPSLMQNVEFINADALEMQLLPTDLVICYYTVQFIHPSKRQEFIDKIYRAMNWGGALLMFEKVRGSDARFQDILTTLYNEYKLKIGYTPDDIISKTLSLKGVLEPFSTQGNVDMLKRSGFNDIYTVQKYLCFEGFLAIK